MSARTDATASRPGLPPCHDGTVQPADLDTSSRVQREQLAALLASYAHRRPVTKVAVVGNAPLPPSEERAREIDSADLVLRMNSLQLDEPGDPPRLGRRCDVVLLSRNTRMTRWGLRDYRRRLYLVPQAGFTTFYGLRDRPEHWPADLGALPVPNGAVVKRPRRPARTRSRPRLGDPDQWHHLPVPGP